MFFSVGTELRLVAHMPVLHVGKILPSSGLVEAGNMEAFARRQHEQVEIWKAPQHRHETGCCEVLLNFSHA